SPGADTVRFDASVFPPGGRTPITLAAALPTIDGTEGIIIDGSGADVVLDANGAPDGLPFGPFSATLSGIVVRNLTVRGAATGVSASAEVVSGVLIDGVTIVDATGSNRRGINIFGNQTVEDVQIDRCTLSVSGGTALSIFSIDGTDGVHIRRSTAAASRIGFSVGSNGRIANAVFESVTASGNERAGLSFFGGGGFEDLSATDIQSVENGAGWELTGGEMTRVRIANSEFRANDDGGIRLTVTTTAGVSESSVEGNRIVQNDGTGLSLVSTGPAGITISENDVLNNGTTESDHGISFGVGETSSASGISGNTVSGNAGAGILAFRGRVAISENVTQNNGLLGIDLRPTNEPAPFITANDPGDSDEGVNRLQNTPDLVAAPIDGGQTLAVTYAVDSAPANATYPLRVEFFLADDDGEEGQTFLGADAYPESDAQAQRTAVFTIDAPVADGARLLATATDADGNTSEFSAPLALALAPTSAGPDVVSEGIRLTARPNPDPLAVHLGIDGPLPSARVALFDALGREVAVLHEGPLATGEHTLALEAAALPAGVYIVRVVTPAGTASQAVTIVR
ncbi:MAG: right-handed parallel beta-helix repeat-containing protein, partial [Bacteroidota bacterium]